ncbi:MAG: hypothetical protein ACYC1C_20860 [Chloroflexota bacterium]
MTRYLLVHHEGGEYLLPETIVPTEAKLHDAFEKHPELMPTDELDLGQAMVVGREVSFESGAADLVCVDEAGQILIVEVKKGAENADARRVVAQLLDYGSRLWGYSYDDFESKIALPYFRKRNGPAAPSSLKQAAATLFNFEDAEHEADTFAEALARNLETGTFHYLVVARTLPPNLTTVLQYLGEVSRVQTAAILVDYYMDGDRHILAPHVAFSSAATKRKTTPPPPTARTTPEQFLLEVGPETNPFWSAFLEFVGTLPGRFYWGTKGFSYRIVVDGKPYTVLRGYPRTAWWLVEKRKGDELSIITKPAARAPKSLVKQLADATAELSQCEGAEPYSGTDENSVLFYTGTGIAKSTDQAIRRTLRSVFKATTGE